MTLRNYNRIRRTKDVIERAIEARYENCDPDRVIDVNVTFFHDNGGPCLKHHNVKSALITIGYDCRIPRRELRKILKPFATLQPKLGRGDWPISVEFK